MADNQPAEVDIDNIIDRLLEGMFALTHNAYHQSVAPGRESLCISRSMRSSISA